MDTEASAEPMETSIPAEPMEDDELDLIIANVDDRQLVGQAEEAMDEMDEIMAGMDVDRIVKGNFFGSFVN